MGKKRYKYDEELFTREDDISYYLLGVMVTDGSITFNKKVKHYYLSLGSSDFYWIKNIKDLCSEQLSLSKMKNKEFWLFRTNNKNYIDWLLNNSCVPSKSLSLEFPKNIPEKYLPDFLRGVLDGDGSLQFAKRKKNSKSVRAYICSSSLNFILEINKCFDLFNLKYNFSTEKAGKINKFKNSKEIIKLKHDAYRTTLSHKDAYKLMKILYYKGNNLSLERKQKIADDIIYYYENVWTDGKDENNPAAILTNNQVIQIRKLWNSGDFKKKSLLIKHCKEILNINIGKTTYYQVINGDTFKNIK